MGSRTITNRVIPAVLFIALAASIIHLIVMMITPSVEIGLEEVQHIQIEFEDIFYGQTASETFVLENVSARTLMLKGVTECGCARMGIDGDYVESGSEITATLSYLSFLQQSTGHIEKQFAVSNIAHSSPGRTEEQTVLDGILNVYVKPTVVFYPDKCEFLVSEGREFAVSKILEVENAGNYPISLEVADDVNSRIGFTALPNNFTIAPQDKCKVELTFDNSEMLDQPAYVSDIEFSGSLSDQHKQIPLRFLYPVKIIPTKSAISIPGSLFFSGAKPEETRELRISGLDGTDPTINSISVPEGIAVEESDKCRYSVTFNKHDIKPGIFNKKIIFKGYAGEQEFSIEVPVMSITKASSSSH